MVASENAARTSAITGTSSHMPAGDTVHIQINEARDPRRTAEELIRQRRKAAFLRGR